MLKTRFTDLLNLDLPVMSAPMSNHSGGQLAAAVSLAGGLGTFGGTNDFGPEWLREQIAHVRSRTDRAFGLGFITQLIETNTTNFEIALEERVPVFVFSFADPGPWLPRAKDAGAVTICQVQSLELARQSVDAGADVLLAQGNEAGGHTGGMNLLPLLVALAEQFPTVPVLAAGGITTGRALAGVLGAGGEGASLGTAVLATPEAVEVPDSFKERIVLSDGQDTTFTRVYDLLGTRPWPEGIAGRVYRNRLVRGVGRARRGDTGATRGAGFGRRRRPRKRRHGSVGGVHGPGSGPRQRHTPRGGRRAGDMRGGGESAPERVRHRGRGELQKFRAASESMDSRQSTGLMV